MFETHRARLVGLAVVLGGAGCSVLKKDVEPDRGFQGHGVAPVTRLPEIAPYPISLDLNHLAPTGTTSRAPVEVRYRGLREFECRDIAARGSTLGNLLDAKARECCPEPTTRRNHPLHHKADEPERPDLRGEILRVAALEARNHSAANALELYYRLAQAVAQRDVLRDSQTTVRRGLDERDRLREVELTVPAAFDELQRQQREQVKGLAEFNQATEQLSSKLRGLLNLGPMGESWQIWPVVDLAVDGRRIDPEQAVAIGLARRPEMILLRRLDHGQGPETLAALKSVLSSFEPLLGLECQIEIPSHPFLKSLGKAERESQDNTRTRRLWDRYRLERERQIANEIRAAAVKVQRSLDQVGIARDQVRSLKAELADLQAQQREGMADYGALLQAELRLLESRSNLWASAFEWRIAVTRLHEAQFLLLP